MDYDDNEFNGQNRQLAGEGCSKVSPVLHPYALPKFDFDDTLHGHLNFSRLVENEVFIGQEDKQWIEEYSCGSSGIEFNSNGVVLRRNNVWSEATSSESVEMLPKSVGQEEKVVGTAVIEQLDPDICDEILSITKAMDPNLNQEFPISGGGLDSVIINEKHNLSVLEEKVDSTCDNVILKEPNKDHPGSSENVGASVEEFNAAETSNPFGENLSAETSTSFRENLSAETSNLFSENMLVETSNPFEKPYAEYSILFHENLSMETSITLSKNPSAVCSTPFIENPSTETSTSPSEKTCAKSSIQFIENPSAKTSILFSEKSAIETSFLFSENLSNQTSILFSETPQSEDNIVSETPSQMLKLKDPDSPKSNAGSLSKISPIKVSSIEENKTVIEQGAQPIISDTSMVSAGNLSETGCERSGSVEVDCKITSSEPGATHLDQDASFNEKVDASLPLESNDMNIEVVQDADSLKNVKSSLLLKGNTENNLTAYKFESDVSVPAGQATAENNEQPKSPIFGVSLVHQDSKENTEVGCTSKGNSQNEFSQIESVGASVSKSSSPLVEKKASLDLAERAIHEIDVHCVTPIWSCNTSQIEQEHGTKNDIQDCFKKLETKPFDSSKKTSNNSQTGWLQDLKEPMIQGNDMPEGKNITFEVNKTTDLGHDGKGSMSYPTFQISNLPKTIEGRSKDFSSNQMDLKKLHEVSVGPQNPSGAISQIGVKGKSERKTRRKLVGQESTRKGTFSARASVRGEILPVLLTPPATAQVTSFEEVKSHENVTKPGVVLSSPKIPDLNNSTFIFQQRFTDGQQVQLRAQILVYGSLISGSPPEETHMIAAFGQSDVGRTWDSVWRTCLERLHVQKSQPKSSTPTQSQADTRDAGSRSDQVIILDTSIQNIIPSSPIRGPNKSTPHSVSPMFPFSSPLWNTPTPSDNLQSSGMEKAAHFDYHQILSPLRPTYQTPAPPFLNYNSSWLSQGPFPGQWLAALPIPTFNPTPRFPSVPATEPMKLTPVKDSGGSELKQTSNLTLLSSSPIIFPDASSLSGMKRSAISSDQRCSDSKSRYKANGIPVVSIPCSASVGVSMHAFMASNSSPENCLSTVASPTDHTKSGNRNLDKVISEETSTKVEESKLQAKEATEHADNAMFHCNGVWSQVQIRYNYDFNSIDEAKLVSSAVSIAAAASVAKVAAAAAKIASDVAEQARLMVNNLNRSQNLDQRKAASASSNHAENLHAIIKAAELAAEAVSQAGKIVAMSEPFSLRDLVEAGPGGYWKTPWLASKQQALVAENLNVIEKINTEIVPDRGILATGSGGELPENQTMDVDGTSVPFTSHEKDKRKPQAHTGPEAFKTTRAVPVSEIGSIGTSIVGQTEPKISSVNLKESDIKEGCLVEVYKDDDEHNGAWFGANVLSLKDGNALISYTEIQSDDGSGKFKEWLPLEVEGSEVPKIRLAHPVTAMQRTRKRRRTAATDFMWSSGDRVDVWMQNHWREGVVMEMNKNDTSLTVQFPAQGKTSVVRSWFVRPTLIWKDGLWILHHTSEKRLSSLGNRPRQKRLKLGSLIAVTKKKAGLSEDIDLVGPRKQESRSLSLSTHESVFNVGSTRDNKVTTHRTTRSGLRKEGPGVIFGAPKPGRKQKFMDVSKHYVADGSNITTHDSMKFTRYLIPHPPGSCGWKNNSRSDLKEKQAAETKPQMLKSRKPSIPSVRTLSTKSIINKSSLDSVSDGENQSGRQIQTEHGCASSIENKFERLNRRKFTPNIGGKALPELVEPRRSNRKIQPTSRLLEGFQSSMTISKRTPLSHSTHRSHKKVTTKVAERKEASNNS